MARMLAFVFLLSLYLLHPAALDIEIDQTVTFHPQRQVVHRVKVGDGDKFAFQPGYVNADVGDLVTFEFHKLNHTLSQSSLEWPCISSQQLESGFNQLNPTDRNDLILTITVNSLEPRWFFCRQINPYSHCHAGMVFALNPGDRMSQFLANARALGGSATVTTAPSLITGSLSSGTMRLPLEPSATRCINHLNSSDTLSSSGANWVTATGGAGPTGTGISLRSVVQPEFTSLGDKHTVSLVTFLSIVVPTFCMHAM
ncbi:hypothetical protein I7I51_01977 [Histoplasma capsulatum]|uniref:Extracellular serine-rich protein n=1 Tax=Ajellomyces capsulatus TaxID=5037 RepID=A0A8A1MK12_AJECA|nr:hypothetical protein I7I51_01977 [Histoplasma capsulatum]